MNQTVETTRRFKVHARHVDSHHARVLEEASFEAAAVAYVEGFDLSGSANDSHEISVIVHDIGSGHEHCFKIDLESGETIPCG